MKRLVPCCFLLLVSVVEGQQAPEQTVAGLDLAPGLEVTRFASEPALSNPTNITVDERGRVWVLEAVNYRRASRKQPDLRPEGDRIVILEDTDHDGQADKVRTFDQSPEIRAPLGIAVLGDKVYVSQSPDLIVYTKDADDNIVKKEVLLTGWGGVDHDHGVHAVVFGPDGKLYFNQGNTGFDITDRSGKRIRSKGEDAGEGAEPGYYEGVALRMNTDGTELEVLGQNFRNPYELAVDSFGNVFQTDNDDDGNAWTRLLYNMEGGNYGFRGPLNRTWREDRGSHWHLELPGVVPLVLRTGAGSPCGLAVYEGRVLPEKYRGQLLHAEAGQRIIALYSLSDDGAGYSAVSEDVMNGGEDTWARPSDVAVAPDGSLFVADWYDPGVGGHQMGDAKGTQGRIYRLALAGSPPHVPEIDLASASGLTAAFGSPNQSVQYLAHRAIVAQGERAVPLLQTFWRRDDPILKARALWILGGLGDAGPRAIQEALRDPDPRFRILGLRVAQLHGADMLRVSQPLLGDGSPLVRREIAVMLQDRTRMLPPYLVGEQVQPSQPWLDAVTELVEQYDGEDRWYLEALAIAARGREDALYGRLKSDHGGKLGPPLNRLVWALRPRAALPDLVEAIDAPSRSMEERELALDTLGAMQWPEAARAMESFITGSSSPAALVERAFGLYSHQLFSLWMEARTSPALPAVMRKGFALPGAQSAAVSVADRLKDPQYVPELLALAKSAAAIPEARAAALESAAMDEPRYLNDFQALAERGPTPVRAAAVRAVANLAPPNIEPWAQKLVLSDAPNEVRTSALRLLAESAAGLTAILDMAEEGTLPPELRTLARNVTNHAGEQRGGRRESSQSPVALRQTGRGDDVEPAILAIRERAAKVLPMPAATQIPTSFQLDLSYRGVVADGRKWFEADAGCAACHSLGGKNALGPDLSAIGAKYGKQAMLDHIVNPNDAIGPEYITTMFTLKSGDQLLGLVVDEAPDRIVVQTGAGQQRRLAPSDVASRQRSQVSSMPEGLLDNLSLQQIADLLEFLSTLK